MLISKQTIYDIRIKVCPTCGDKYLVPTRYESRDRCDKCIVKKRINKSKRKFLTKVK